MWCQWRYLQFYYGYGEPEFSRSVFKSGWNKEETFRDKISRYHAVKEQEVRKKQRKAEEKKRRLNNDLIDIYREWYRKSEPFSDAWADCYNALQYQLYMHEILNETEG